jgi:type IV secretory pathway TrbD component
MAAARPSGEFIPGYHATIHQAFTVRITTAGVPRMWFILEVIGAIFFAFVLFSVFQSWIAVLPLLLAFGVHVGLVLAMRWDPEFDSVVLYSVRYRGYYHAG